MIPGSKKAGFDSGGTYEDGLMCFVNQAFAELDARRGANFPTRPLPGCNHGLMQAECYVMSQVVLRWDLQ